jgi:hypothetical protein
MSGVPEAKCTRSATINLKRKLQACQQAAKGEDWKEPILGEVQAQC